MTKADIKKELTVWLKNHYGSSAKPHIIAIEKAVDEIFEKGQIKSEDFIGLICPHVPRALQNFALKLNLSPSELVEKLRVGMPIAYFDVFISAVKNGKTT